MNITPTKEERAAVVAILSSEAFEDPDDMARELIKAVYGLLCERTGYGVGIGLQTDDMALPHGPYFNLGDAKRVVAEAQSRGLRAFIAPLFGPGRALLQEQESHYKRCQCGHPKALHGEGKLSTTGCAVFHRQTKEQCPCRTFQTGS